jgi:hypothetical protein
MQAVSQHTDYAEIYLQHAQSLQAPVFTTWTSFFLKKWNAIYPLKKIKKKDTHMKNHS